MRVYSKMPISQDFLQHQIQLRRNKESLRNIADSFHTPTNNSITYGDIYRILHGEFPIGNKKRIALGLSPICPLCKRRLGRVVRKKDLFSTPEKELREMFEHRTEM